MSKYANLATSGYIVMPVAMETVGPFAPLALKFIKDIGFRITDNTGEKRSANYLFQKIGIDTQRGNAASVAGTVPSMKPLDEIYYL